jgi:hypothetical protein
MALNEYDELQSYLASSRIDLQEETLKIIIHLLSSSSSHLTSTDSPFHYFSSEALLLQFIDLMKNPTLVSYILTILNLLLTSTPPSSDADPTAAEPNSSSSSSRFLSPENFEKMLTILLTYLLTSSNSTVINLSLVSLTNLTIETEGMSRVLEKIYGNQNILSALLKKFLEYNPQLEGPSSLEGQEGSETTDPWQYFSSVLCNLCRDERIQLFLLNKSTNYISLLMKQVTASPPPSITTPLLLPLLLPFIRSAQGIPSDEEESLEASEVVCSRMNSIGGLWKS